MTSDREHDVVVYGATGFVGKLTAAYLAKQEPGPRIALAGRSKDKLEAVRSSLGAAAAQWPLIVADASDTGSVEALAASTTSVATTVGPYMKYGIPLAAACAAAGTHYADLTGEVRFVRHLLETVDATAKASGARIVVSCGFDSIPSDLGVFVLRDGVRRDGAGELEETKLVVTALKGGVSGGTIDTMRSQVDDMKADSTFARMVADPYALSPDRDKEPELGDESDVRKPVKDADLGKWLGPFVMGAYNTRVVRLSNSLQDWDYGRSFRYQEYMGFPGHPGGLAAAAGMTGALGALMGGMSVGPTRRVLDKILPEPGEGPSEKVQRNGHFAMDIHARTSTGATYVATVTGKGDPGYAATAVMLAESALALALDGDALPSRAGVLTPAAGIGQPLVDRLRKHRFTFDVNAVA
ncbi:MAG: saccharopine dehydrogenase NADP-binding domain-containing protein [Frankiaceae bacterium]|nr:saccharopine dehydrogenase NADP-binding domain-containing protein [Frankiaceae bacterium]